MEHQANGSAQLENNIIVHIRKAKGEFPYSPREGCVACGVGPNVYVFGGVIQSDHAEPQETNELLVFSTETESWQKVTGSGSPPAPRAAASLVAVGNELYLFGGLSHMTGWFDDLFVFDTESKTWREVETQGNKPRARDKLQGVAIGTNIYYFGGFGPKTAQEEMDDDWEDEEDEEEEDELPEAQEQEGAEFGWFNDLFVLDTVSHQWSQPLQMNLGVPTPRAAHGMCAIGSHLYIFGGRDFEDRQNDLHCFDVVSRKWNMELKCEGKLPEPRSFHSACAVGQRVIVMGGRGRDNSHYADIHVYDCEKGQWLQPCLRGVAMEARGQHVAVVAGKTMVMFGGTGEFSADTMQCQRFFTDTLLISTDELCLDASSPAVNGGDHA